MTPWLFNVSALSMGNWGGAIVSILVLTIALGGDRWQIAGLGAIAWLAYGWWQKQPQTARLENDCQDLTRRLKDIQAVIDELTTDEVRNALSQEAEMIGKHLQQTQPRVAVLGVKGVGKTAVVRALSEASEQATQADSPQLWSSVWSSARKIQPKKITLLDTHTETGDIAIDRATDAELVVMVVAGDLTATEYRFIQASRQRMILALNKTDLLLPNDRDLICQNIIDCCQNLIAPEDIVMIAAQPRPITVRQYDRDTTALVQRWQEVLPPVIEPLKQRIAKILDQEWQQLWRQKIERQLIQLKTQAEGALLHQRRKLAELAIVRQQKIIALSVFASPSPTVDIAANLVLNSQLLLEIATIYHHPLSLAQARQLAGDMGKQLVQLGGVEIATTTISAFLKTNFVTYAIGGLIQSLSAVYFTQLCAQSFMDYLEQKPICASASQKSTIENDRPVLSPLTPQPIHQWLMESVPRILTYRRPAPTTEK